MDFLKEAKKREQEIIQTLSDLINIPSVLFEQPNNLEAPFGDDVRKSLDYSLKLGQDFGFETLNIDNVAGHLEYGTGEEILGILCHLDVVPAGDGWIYDPFNATIVENRIYGRGAIDDKGPTVAALYALKILKDLEIVPQKRVRIILGTDEETAWRGINKYLEQCEMPTVGFAPDANFPLIYGEKGIYSLSLDADFKDNVVLSFNSGERLNMVPSKAEAIITKDLNEEFSVFLQQNNLKGSFIENDNNYTVILEGKSAHAMQPELGVNAAVKLAKFLSNFSSSPVLDFLGNKLDDTRLATLGLNYKDSEMDDLTMNVGLVQLQDEKIKIGLNFRFPINWPKDDFNKNFNQYANKAGLKVSEISYQDVHYVSKDDDLVKTLHKAYIKYTNDNTTPLLTLGGGTYARALDKAVAFGMMFPGREDVVHQANEYVIIEDLILATAIYAEAIYQLVK